MNVKMTMKELGKQHVCLREILLQTVKIYANVSISQSSIHGVERSAISGLSILNTVECRSVTMPNLNDLQRQQPIIMLRELVPTASQIIVQLFEMLLTKSTSGYDLAVNF